MLMFENVILAWESLTRFNALPSSADNCLSKDMLSEQRHHSKALRKNNWRTTLSRRSYERKGNAPKDGKLLIDLKTEIYVSLAVSEFYLRYTLFYKKVVNTKVRVQRPKNKEV